MKKIVNSSPSTFFSGDADIKIYDCDKRHFYFRANPEREITFNLPKGEYYTNNTIEKKNVFLPYEATYKGFTKDWFNTVKVYVCNNENKATIFPSERKIFIDKKVAYHEYKPLTMFVLSHEFSHLLPEGRGIKCNSREANFCDINGGNYLITIGLNPSQIVLSTKILYKAGMRGLCVTAAMSNFKR